MEENITSFIAKVRLSGGSLEVTVPYEIVEFEGLEAGDTVKILIKKMPKKD